MVILLGLLAMVPILGVAIILPWRLGLLRAAPSPAEAAQSQQEALDDLRRAEALHPSGRRPLVSTRRGRTTPMDRSLASEATALLEAQALEGGALERAVAEWAS